MRDRDQRAFEEIVEHGPLKYQNLAQRLPRLDNEEVTETINFLVEQGFVEIEKARIKATPEYEDWP